MPFDWPAQALQAQAVAARSYALANLTKDRDFDLYSDTRDQVYGGVDAEFPAASAAVTATKGKVVLYKGKVANTLFFSTSGGRTASSLEATGDAVPYLVSVADPYDSSLAGARLGPGPVRRHEGRRAAEAPRLALGSDDRRRPVRACDASSPRSGPGAPRRRSPGRSSVRCSSFGRRGSAARCFSLLPAARTVTYGGALTLSGFAKGDRGRRARVEGAGEGLAVGRGPDRRR